MTTLTNFGGNSSPNPLSFAPQAIAAGEFQLLATLQPKPEDNSRFPLAMLRTLTVALSVESGHLDGLKIVALRTRGEHDAAWIFDSTGAHEPHPHQAQIGFPDDGIGTGEVTRFQVPIAHPPIAEVRIYGKSSTEATVSGSLSWDPGAS